MNNQRNKTARTLIRKLNKIRHEQAKKIDILCNDMVSAHSDFIKRLRALTFGVNFYEALLKENDLPRLLDSAADLIKSYVSNSNVAIFLLESDGFELHMTDEEHPIEVDKAKLESCFTPQVVSSICRSNQVCSLNDMFEMGLAGNLAMLGSISAAAIPLGRFGGSTGFILIYRSSDDQLTADELERITAIVPGLCDSIKSRQALSRT